jgi:5-formyltetrahydrofolate cyclo-ligase
MRVRLRENVGDSTALRDAIARWLSMHPECRTVAIFAALPGEPDLLPLVKLHPERRWVLPNVQGDALSFHEVADPEIELITGAFNIREPRADTALIPIQEIDVFFCPGLAFDLLGNRLGRGRGFYDRMLEMARRDSHKLGVCFPFQLVADTYPEPHDIRMDGLITPNPAP